ncbi:MAG: 50S ribosomal protein L37ae [Promethearchaeota archaeon]
MGRTKKVDTTGRFGTRYGATLRKRILRIEKMTKEPHTCPSCEAKRIKRVSVGIWQCKFCGRKYAGGAYIPLTAAGKDAKRTSRRLAEQKET